MALVEEEARNFEANNSFWGVFFESAVRGFFGDPFGKYTEINSEQAIIRSHYETANKAIKTTFRECLDVADAYGVDTTPYR